MRQYPARQHSCSSAAGVVIAVSIVAAGAALALALETCEPAATACNKKSVGVRGPGRSQPGGVIMRVTVPPPAWTSPARASRRLRGACRGWPWHTGHCTSTTAAVDNNEADDADDEDDDDDDDDDNDDDDDDEEEEGDAAVAKAPAE